MTRRVRESELEAMRKRAEAAEAHCERLRKGIKALDDAQGNWNVEYPFSLLEETPAQTLREIRAEAGREGYIDGYRDASRHMHGVPYDPPPESDKRYADQIRRQGDE